MSLRGLTAGPDCSSIVILLKGEISCCKNKLGTTTKGCIRGSVPGGVICGCLTLGLCAYGWWNSRLCVGGHSGRLMKREEQMVAVRGEAGGEFVGCGTVRLCWKHSATVRKLAFLSFI